MAPVSRTLVEICNGVGSSLVAKIEVEDCGNSIGPSSWAAPMVGSSATASKRPGSLLEWYERVDKEVGLWKESEREGL